MTSYLTSEMYTSLMLPGMRQEIEIAVDDDVIDSYVFTLESIKNKNNINDLFSFNSSWNGMVYASHVTGTEIHKIFGESLKNIFDNINLPLENDKIKISYKIISSGTPFVFLINQLICFLE